LFARPAISRGVARSLDGVEVHNEAGFFCRLQAPMCHRSVQPQFVRDLAHLGTLAVLISTLRRHLHGPHSLCDRLPYLQLYRRRPQIGHELAHGGVVVLDRSDDRASAPLAVRAVEKGVALIATRSWVKSRRNRTERVALINRDSVPAKGTVTLHSP